MVPEPLAQRCKERLRAWLREAVFSRRIRIF